MRAAAEADLATPARIRHAAIDLFGRHGFAIGLRAIAQEAGVSLGLIRHHFGSKDGLRAVCDKWVLDEYARLQAEQAGLDTRGLLEQIANADDYRPLVAYVLQALGSGGELAQSFWKRMVTDTVTHLERGVAAGQVKPSIDPAARARMLTLMELGAMMLEVALAPEGEEFSTTWRRWVDGTTLPGLELYTQGLLADGSMLDEYLAYMKDPPAEQPGTSA